MATAIQKKSDGHSRIIWACAWTNDSMFFGTVSRDKTLKVWKLIDVQQVEDNDDGAERTSINVQLVSSFAAEHSLNALDFAHTPLAELVLLIFSFKFCIRIQCYKA